MRTLWQRMAEIYGHRWTSAYGDDAGKGAGVTWAKGLAGITAEQMKTGVESVLVAADPWPPSLPEFRAMCLAVPSLAAIRAEQRANGKPSAFMRLLHQHLDHYRMRHADADKADRMFREAYETAREHVMRGGALPPEPVAYIGPAEDDQPVKPAAPEVVAEVASKLKAVLGEDA
jgi:hypothetical protein